MAQPRKEKLEEMLEFAMYSFERYSLNANSSEEFRHKADVAAQAVGSLTVALQNYKEPKPEGAGLKSTPKPR